MAANEDILRNARQKLAKKFYDNYGELISQLEDIYTMSFVRQDGSQKEALVLDKVWELFAEKPRRPLLLLGDAGMGKTSAELHFCKKLWEGIQAGEDYPLPLYINLPQYKEYLEQRLLWRVFEDARLSYDEQIAIENNPLLLVLDGFNEVSIEHNIYRTQGWGRGDLKIGMLVCCRPEAFINKNTEILFESAEKLYLQSFNKEQIETYLEKYLAKKGKETSAAPSKSKEKDNNLTVKEYTDWLEKLPSLKVLAKIPFLLSVVAQSLPTIIRDLPEDRKDEIFQRQFTQNELFHQFLSNWFEKQAAKMEMQRSLAGLRHKEIAGYMCAYAKNLANSQIKANGTLEEALITDEESLKLELIEPVHDEELLALYHHSNPKERHSRFFFKEKKDGNKRPIKENIRIIRSGCLLHTMDKKFKFLHKSIVEYLAMQELMEGILGNCDHYLENLFAHKENWDPSLNRTPLKDLSIISNLAEEVRINHQFKELLRKILYASKEIPKLGIAAANAITILNYADVDFSGEDLSEVQIPGANLSDGIFIGTNFNGANLEKVCFKRANLSNALWRGASVEEVDFGDEMYLSLPAEIRAFRGGDPGLETEEMQVLCKDGRIYIFKLNELDFFKKIRTKKMHLPFYIQPIFSNNFHWGTIFLEIWSLLFGFPLFSFCFAPFFVIPLILVFGGESSDTIDFSSDWWDAFFRNIFLFPALVLGVIFLIYRIICFFMTPAVSLFCNEDHLFISGYQDGKIHIWLKWLEDSYIPNLGGHFVNRSPSRPIVLSGHTDSVISLACTGSSYNTFASGSKDKTIRLWQLPEGKFTFLLRGHEGSVTSLSFAPSYSYSWLASGSEDKTVRLWRLPEGKADIILRRHEGTVTSLVFTRDSQWLVSGSEDETIRLWQLPTGTAGLIIRGNQGAITALAVIADKKVLLSASRNTIRFWKAWGNPHSSEYTDKNKTKLCLQQGLDITETLHLSPANQAFCEQRGSNGKPNSIGKSYQAWCNLFQPIPGTGHCQSQPSLIRVGSQRLTISENIWVLSVVREINLNRSKGSSWFSSFKEYNPTNPDNHGFLILEGIKNHRRFILRAELRADMYTRDVQITLKPLADLERFKESAKKFEANQRAISGDQGMDLLHHIRTDQQRTIRYNPLGSTNGGSSSSQISSIESHNCWSWCRTQMEQIGWKINEEKAWYGFLVTLPSDIIPKESHDQRSSLFTASMQKR